MMHLLIVIFGITMLIIFATSRIEIYIQVLMLQGLLFFLMILLDYDKFKLINLIFLGIETLVFKTLIFPLFFSNVIRKHEITREVEPYIPQLYSLIIASLIFVFGFFISYLVLGTDNNLKPLSFGISFSTIISSLFLIIIRKKIITHILGYMFLENGIFLLSLSVANEMPLLVNLGVLLDLFVGIFLLVIFFNRIQMVYDKDHIDVLTGLKD